MAMVNAWLASGQALLYASKITTSPSCLLSSTLILNSSNMQGHPSLSNDAQEVNIYME